MYDYADPSSRAKQAQVALAIHAVVLIVAAASTIVAPMTGSAAPIVAVIPFLTFIAAGITVARWIYRANDNAHGFAEGMTMTPGWNVGWFFVPLANLWKPFEGVAEVWRASADAGDETAAATPALLRWWWACWLIGNMTANGTNPLLVTDRSLAKTFDLMSSLLLGAAAVLLIRIIGEITRRQPIAHAAQAARAFA